MNGPVGLQFGDFTLDVSERLLLREGRPVPLTPKAFDVLAALAARPGRLVTKDELLKEVWPDSFVEESNLAYHVFALRRALGETPDGEKYVATVPKRGYRFVAPLKGASVADAGAAPIAPHDAPAARVREEIVASGESRFFGRAAVVWFAAGALTASAAGLLIYSGRPTLPREPVRVEVSTPVRLTETSAFALSPDGRSLVFAGTGPDGVLRLWLRSLDTSGDRPLPGTEVAVGGIVPPMFWSPDSRFVGFDAVGQLKKVDIAGGPAQTVCTLPSLAVGGTWNQDGVILVGSPDGGVFRCPAAGGPASVVTRPDASREESAHILPWFLPDGRRFMYLSVSRSVPENSGIFVHTLDTPSAPTSSRRVLATGFGAAYVPDAGSERGHLVFMRDGALLAQAFDPSRLELTGETVRIAEPVGSFLDGAFFSAARSGAVAFRPPQSTVQLTWLDRRGVVLGRVGNSSEYRDVVLAPGETRAMVVHHTVRAAVDQDLWLVNLESGRSSRVTFDDRLEDSPVWSEDGKRVVFTANGAIGSLFEQSVGDEQDPRLLLESPHHKVPTSISADGQYLLYTSENIGSTRGDVWVLPLRGGKPYPLIRRALDQGQARFSPDGRWVAYVSNESGRQEVMIRRFAPTSSNEGETTSESTVVSQAGGFAPRWRGDGGELFFLTPEGAFSSVSVTLDPVLKVGSPAALFQAPDVPAQWEVSADGKRFLVMVPEGRNRATSFSLVFDWQRMLDR